MSTLRAVLLLWVCTEKDSEVHSLDCHCDGKHSNIKIYWCLGAVPKDIGDIYYICIHILYANTSFGRLSIVLRRQVQTPLFKRPKLN